MATVDEITGEINKEYGVDVLGSGMSWNESDRVPTGWFPFDLATGGGFPMGGVSVVYGPESSLKTTIGLKAISQYQQIRPEHKCVLIDLEGTYEPSWGETLGVDNKELIYALPDYAEQVVDITTSLLQADDIGIIMIDSLAAMSPENEVTSSAEKASVGSAGLIISKFYRKLTTALTMAKKEGRYPLILAINQIRHKVGVMYGNPETMPGGFAFKFASKLTVRMYGKDIEEKKVHPTMAAWKELNGEVKKWKVPIVSRSFKFNMGSLNSPKHNLSLGQVDDWNTVSNYLKMYDALRQEKPGKPWKLGTYDVVTGEVHEACWEYKTLKDLRAQLDHEPEFKRGIQKWLVKRALEGE